MPQPDQVRERIQKFETLLADTEKRIALLEAAIAREPQLSTTLAEGLEKKAKFEEELALAQANRDHLKTNLENFNKVLADYLRVTPTPPTPTKLHTPEMVKLYTQELAKDAEAFKGEPLTESQFQEVTRIAQALSLPGRGLITSSDPFMEIWAQRVAKGVFPTFEKFARKELELEIPTLTMVKLDELILKLEGEPVLGPQMPPDFLGPQMPPDAPPGTFAPPEEIKDILYDRIRDMIVQMTELPKLWITDEAVKLVSDMFMEKIRTFIPGASPERILTESVHMMSLTEEEHLLSLPMEESGIGLDPATITVKNAIMGSDVWDEAINIVHTESDFTAGWSKWIKENAVTPQAASALGGQKTALQRLWEKEGSTRTIGAYSWLKDAITPQTNFVTGVVAMMEERELGDRLLSGLQKRFDSTITGPLYLTHIQDSAAVLKLILDSARINAEDQGLNPEIAIENAFSTFVAEFSTQDEFDRSRQDINTAFTRLAVAQGADPEAVLNVLAGDSPRTEEEILLHRAFNQAKLDVALSQAKRMDFPGAEGLTPISFEVAATRALSETPDPDAVRQAIFTHFLPAGMGIAGTRGIRSAADVTAAAEALMKAIESVATGPAGERSPADLLPEGIEVPRSVEEAEALFRSKPDLMRSPVALTKEEAAQFPFARQLIQAVNVRLAQQERGRPELLQQELQLEDFQLPEITVRPGDDLGLARQQLAEQRTRLEERQKEFEARKREIFGREQVIPPGTFGGTLPPLPSITSPGRVVRVDPSGAAWYLPQEGVGFPAGRVVKRGLRGEELEAFLAIESKEQEIQRAGIAALDIAGERLITEEKRRRRASARIAARTRTIVT